MAIKLYVGDLDAVGLSNKYMLIILHKISVSKLSKVVIAIETCQVYLLPTYLPKCFCQRAFECNKYTYVWFAIKSIFEYSKISEIFSREWRQIVLILIPSRVICRHFQLEQINKDLFGAVVVAQLAEWSLPTPKVHGLNPDVYFPIVNCIEKTEIKNRCQEWPISWKNKLNQDSHRKTCVDFLKLAKPNVNKFHVDYLDYNKIDGGLKHFDWFKRWQ